MLPQLDQRDKEIIRDRLAIYDKVVGPRIGDFIVYPNHNGIVHRVSHVWRDDDFTTPVEVQTCKDGSFYLGPGYVEYSGGLFICTPVKALNPTHYTMDGGAWIFHHNDARAFNGVHATVPFRLYTCDIAPKKY